MKFLSSAPMMSELRRKGVHLLLALFFILIAPYVEAGALVTLALGLFIYFLLFRIVFGSSDHPFGVSRRSYGEFFFVAGVCASAILAGKDVQLFQLSMVVLGIADSFAALFGMKFGVHMFTIYGERRTYEGSVAFGCITFLAVVFFGFGLVEACFVAVGVTLVEALAVRGSDNFFIPVSLVAMLTYF